MRRALLLFAICTSGIFAQVDPYHLEFENDWVRVSRITYPAFGKSATHEHPDFPVIYIYTTDGGPISFIHSENIIIDRPAVQAGGIRFNRGGHERHQVESQSATPSEYLRIELKTEPLELPRTDVRIAPSEDRGFENAQIRIEKSVCAAGQKCGTPALHSVLVTLNDRKVAWTENGEPSVVNTGDQPVKVIQIAIKTAPKAR